MTKIKIQCRNIEDRGKRLCYSLSDAGMENVNDEKLNARIDELRERLDFDELEDGDVVDVVDV